MTFRCYVVIRTLTLTRSSFRATYVWFGNCYCQFVPRRKIDLHWFVLEDHVASLDCSIGIAAALFYFIDDTLLSYLNTDEEENSPDF